jgi:hypothetical protein
METSHVLETFLPVHPTALANTGEDRNYDNEDLTQCGRVTQICVFNTVKLGTSTSSP